MNRSLCVLAALLLACAALAAPAPEPFVSGWGYPVDPDSDCKIKRDNGVLTIEMPGSLHDYDPRRKRYNAPRLLRELDGNFDLQVRVRIDYCLSSQSTVKGQPSYVSAGLLLIYPETGRPICDRLEFAVSQQGSRLDGYAVAPLLSEPRRKIAAVKGIGAESYALKKCWFCEKQRSDMTWNRRRLDHYLLIWDRGWQGWFLAEKTDFAYLRLEQRDTWYYFYISPDGEKWTQLEYQPSLPAKSMVGLAAYSTSSEPSKVRFDQLKLTRGKKKSK